MVMGPPLMTNNEPCLRYLALAAAAFLRFDPARFGGVPSAGSTTIRLVTNFLIP